MTILRSGLAHLEASSLLPSGIIKSRKPCRDVKGLSSLRFDLLTIDLLTPVLVAALDKKPDMDIWIAVYPAISPTRPSIPTQPVASSIRGSSHVEEIHHMYVDIHGFKEAFFSRVPNLEDASESISAKCKMLAKSNQSVSACISVHKLDIGFVPSYDMSGIPPKYDWSRFLLTGEMRENANMDNSTTTALDLERYARKAHLEGDPGTLFVIKDSWQDEERDQEGELPKRATEADVKNVVRCYHHQTVNVRDRPDSIQDNVRGGPDVIKAGKCLATISTSSDACMDTHEALEDSHNSASINRKRPRAEIDASVPPRKRFCPTTPTPSTTKHRDRSLYEAGILHRHILIDLNHAIKIPPETPLERKAGTRIFMAIGPLEGDQEHSFMHDLESLFWVLIWICTHYDTKGDLVEKHVFENWNYKNDDDLIAIKAHLIGEEIRFLRLAKQYFTQHYQPLI
ncbi:hypothetical protein FHL15_007973 [Xylaria flabelliformis]|uniref:Fungal-type protein kinase domain-containing protein n=1 Tax=Xylaria flabelliformis TaxID=2512241 RepID=A0A553HTB3_9PEZI|nr:hypothetical protein FHL15_007973 [Xylaria flabelliformis]